MSRIGRLPIPVPSGVDVTIDGQHGHRQGPQGLPVATPSPSRSPSSAARTARCWCSVPTTSATAGRCTGSPARWSPTWSPASPPATARRSRSSASATACRRAGSDLEFALGFSHPVPVEAPEGITFEVQAPTRFVVQRHRQAAGRRGRRQHPQAAQARPVQGQGRALPGRGRPPQGRKDGQVMAWQQSTRSPRHKPVGTAQHGASRLAAAPSPPGAQEGHRHAGASAPGRHPVHPAHLRAGRRRHHAATRWRRASTLDAACAAPTATRPRGPPVGELSPSGPRRPASTRSSSTAVATATTAGSRPWPTRPARAGWSSDD